MISVAAWGVKCSTNADVTEYLDYHLASELETDFAIMLIGPWGAVTMPVTRVERIVGGLVIGRVERGSDGYYACHHFGSNVDPLPLNTLDDVADFLRAHPRGGVRMYPGRKKISRNIYIDGIFLR
ncbi:MULTISPECIES: hypothetical protein [Rhizobium/Agrobacterium group]|uniref:Uncharacterized protein n=4 Tax=Rhizobium/Agrobacterium group TaxID=227290 RepID=A0A2Z2PL14_RHIRH|nr:MULTISPECIES: hypothetical protein [Rhizobium/Agrobacterium group]ASK42165.1 hypothetical protein [Rhizobium rhizogenes]MCZ7445590.1 hypothetical protein [Rhizobium rhizogenes]MCZ7472463.1 hypothetical protein [Rhizobium rhizogenes]MCZ7483839.1 hypothetical protein [Rhizobium rhizogenes]MCZ7497563.1 hypothetical protein [Rhizobium rhizogenes]